MSYVLGILLVYLTLAKSQLDPDVVDKINAFAEQMVSCRNVMGLGLSVVQDGETVLANGYGVMDPDSQQPITSKTLFNIASATKQFTATVLGKVLYDNGISWDTKVRDILGEDFYFNDGLRTSQVTLRDLGSHRTGQPRRDFAGYAVGANRRDAAFNTRFVKAISMYRDSYRYNNNMFDIMAYITEVVSGLPFEEAMRQYIFNPASMTSSTFIHEVNLTRPDLAPAYEYYQGGLRYVPNECNSYWARLGGSGSIVTNAEDLGQWLKLQLGRGTLGGSSIIPDDVIDETYSETNPMPQSSRDVFKRPIIPVTYARTEYGLGWQLGWYRGYSMVQHTGGLYGYGALVTLLPDMGLGVALALNGADETYYGRRLLHLYVLDLLLGEEPWLNLTTLCTFPEPWARTVDYPYDIFSDDVKNFMPNNKVKVSTEKFNGTLEAFVGTYFDFFYGNLTITLDETSSALRLFYGVLDPYDLSRTSETVFFGTGTGMSWPLALDDIEFSNLVDGLYQQVVVDIDGSDPTRFTRNLDYSQAPPPPDPDSCGSATP